MRIDRRYVTAALMLVMVLASMEQTITSTAMPTIIGELHGFEHYAWVVAIYLLASTVSMPLYGRLSDALGRKRVILAAIALFCVSSVLASTAQSMGQLILYRGLQGLGAGGIMPVVLTILGDLFTLAERARIQGLFSLIWGGASLGGPALGAFLVNTLGWRSIFYVNLPLGALGFLVLAAKYHDQEKPHTTDLDLPGVAWLAAGCLGLLSAVSFAGAAVPGWALAALLAGSLVAFVLFVRHERGAAHPILPPSLLTHRAIGPSLVASMVLGIGIFAVDTYVPLYVQGGLGGGASAAARVVTPVMLTWATSSMVAAQLVVRWGFRRTAILGSVLVAAGFAGLVLAATLHAKAWVFTAVLALTGCGFGPASMSYLLAAQEAVTWQQRGIVTSSVQFFRTAGGSIGIALLGALFNLLMRPSVPRLRAMGLGVQQLLDPHVRATLPPATLAAIGTTIADGLLWVFVAMLALAVVGVAVSFLMAGRKSTASSPSHHVTTAEALEAMAG